MKLNKISTIAFWAVVCLLFSSSISLADAYGSGLYSSGEYGAGDAEVPPNPPGGGGGSSSSSISSSGSTETSETITLSTGAKAGESKTIKFSKDVGITEIEIKFKEGAAKTSFSVTKLSSKPLDIVTPEGQVNSYLEIETDLQQENLENANIRFKVDKDWLIKKGILFDEIVLQHLDGSWNKLSTYLINSDKDSYYYQAKSPGFSYFAITSIKKQIVANEIDEQPSPSNESNQHNFPEPDSIIDEKPSHKNYSSLSYIVLALAIILIALIGIRKYFIDKTNPQIINGIIFGILVSIILLILRILFF